MLKGLNPVPAALAAFALPNGSPFIPGRLDLYSIFITASEA